MTKPLLYATNQVGHSVAVINTERLKIVDEIPVGDTPRTLSLSPDGARLYVGRRFGVSVVETETRAVSEIPLDFYPASIAYGVDDRLWLLNHQTSYIYQIDAFTGLRSGPELYAGYNGILEVSPDRRNLFYASSASPTTLRQFDITTPSGDLVWQNKHGALGSGGRDIAISNDSKFFALAAGSGNEIQSPYDIGVLDITDKSVLGVFDVGPYPREITLSPDDRIAYVVHNRRAIDVFDVETFEQLDTWPYPSTGGGYATELTTDRTGRYLFAEDAGELFVLDTGRIVVPEPAIAVPLIVSNAAAALARRRSQR